MSTGVVFLNGRFVPVRRARVSALDRGLLYGDGLFETLRADDGAPFALEEHLTRLRRSAERIDLPVPGSNDLWERRIRELLRRNRLDRGSAAVRLTITRGVGGETLVPPPQVRPTLLLTTRRLTPGLRTLQRRGVGVVLLPFHPGLGGLLGGEKTLDYLVAMVGKRTAIRQGGFEGIYTGPGGEIFEGTTSNLFIVTGASLRTPSLRSGVLPGITRQQVIGLACEIGITVREARLSRRHLRSADEAFLTASTIGIVPIRRADRSAIGRGVVGPVTRRLQRMLESLRRVPGS